ncbi:amino acid adenylation domain-containing protein [Ignavibacterium sp.]|uniref:amino acid adenylation domain-containing protein n=1 Tax=Ignavibacterium sp. TaxID=2651167 RepID=UPI00307EFC87
MTVFSLFKEQVFKNPKAVAVSFNSINQTYSKLYDESEKISALLQLSGVKSGDIVAICMNRSPEMISALLGIVKAGAAYLPLDPMFPDKRLEYMLNDSGTNYLLTESSLFQKFNQFKGKFIDISEVKQIKKLDQTNDLSRPDSLAYVIYTSGSTGNPKGVQILHSSLTNFLLSMQKTPGLSSEDNVLALTTLSFDISGLEIFLPLITGAGITIASKDEAKDAKELLKKIKKDNITVVQATPSSWEMLIDSGWNENLNIKALCGGEALTRELADKILDRVDELWNMYGPTETTIWSSCAKVTKEDTIHIGKPITNTQFYIVDNNLNFCPPGVPGELLIGGAGLSIGYLNKPELTVEKFIVNPFDKEKKTKVYRTGDLVKLNSKMQIEFLGRIDSQVKIRGFRIELDEIEAVIKQSELVKDCAVVVKEINNDKKIVAYMILDNPIDKEEITQQIKKIRENAIQKLPDYMIPSLIIDINKFPLTPNNKIDKKALAELKISDVNYSTSSTKPENETQKLLAKIWENLLGITGIGIDDNFFELGGHSILAAQMLADFEKETCKRIPLAEMFTSQTIRQLASKVENGNIKLNWNPLVQIKNGDENKIPLFLIHGAEGNVLLYRDLANRLNSNRTIYGLQAKGLDGKKSFNLSIEEMAEEYIQAIKSVQPFGPYNLGGYCMGGSVAYEIAMRLTAGGEKVANVFLLETYNACTLEYNQLKKTRIKEKIENIKFHFDNVRSLNGKEKIIFVKRKAETAIKRTGARLNKLANNLGISTTDESSSYFSLTLRDINDKAQIEYSPPKYSGKVILLRPKVSFATEPDPNFGWVDFVSGEFRVYNLDVAPRGMLTEPFVKQTSEIIEKELQF